MYLMFADEADFSQTNPEKFFIFGGVLIKFSQLHALHAVILRIRREAGFRTSDSFKSKSRSRPEHVTQEKHTTAKQQLMEAAHEKGVLFVSYATLHAVAQNREHDDLISFGANTILARFNQFLTERNTYGVALFDRMPLNSENSYFKDKFQNGLTFPQTPAQPLSRILAYSSTCDGASHLASVADIVVGSFRYCVNEPEGVTAAANIWPQVVKMMWGRKEGGKYSVRNLGLTLSPQTVQNPEHRAKYDSLMTRLSSFDSVSQ